MRYLLLIILCFSCSTTESTKLPPEPGPNLTVKTGKGCMKITYVHGVNRKWDKVDNMMLNRAILFCSKRNPNRCLLLFERKPNYDYFAFCGIPRN